MSISKIFCIIISSWIIKNGEQILIQNKKKISKKFEGFLVSDPFKKNGIKKLISVSLKKEISSNIVKIKARLKKIKKIFVNVAKKLLTIYF